MDSTALCVLTEEQKRRYYVQPDMIVSYIWETEDGYENPLYVKGENLRFWYNIQRESYAMHVHSSIEIIVPIQSQYTVTVFRDSYVLEPGNILVIPPGYPHALTAPPSGSRFIFLVEPEYLADSQGFSYLQSLLAQPIYIAYAKDPLLFQQEIRLIMQLGEYYWSSEGSRDFRIRSCLLNLFANYGDYCARYRNPIGCSVLPARMKLILDYLEEHYTEALCLDQMASVAGFSKYYFTRVFKRHTNETFYSYLSRKRIRMAQSLLADPDLAVTEIALRCGFSSLSSFNRTFKWVTNRTPSEYRSQCSENKLARELP
ncbi:MAG: AraC family transcriptional regulator [Clostridium sp.]|jgi:AraC-like DNA-binding protein|nr:AraC family transcriptional regulator [Clostridium sp.]